MIGAAVEEVMLCSQLGVTELSIGNGYVEIEDAYRWLWGALWSSNLRLSLFQDHDIKGDTLEFFLV